MTLTEEQKQQIANKLNEFKNERSACDICGSEEWNVLDNLWVVMETPDASVKGEQSIRAIPMVAVMCKQCGHLHFLNSLMFGITPNHGEKETQPQEVTEEK